LRKTISYQTHPEELNAKINDRHALGRGKKDPKYGAFQLYTTAHEISASVVPASLSLEQAVVLPLSISTSAAAFYQTGFLELPYPSTSPKPSGKTILIWGGSSSVGSSAIQLAVASGLTVVTTASKKNFDYVKSLGAKHALDYSDPNIVTELLTVLKGTELVGAFDTASFPDTVKACAEIVKELGGGRVATVLPYAGELPSGVTTHMGKWKIKLCFKL
jgi:NADPH:quinone reductase-like Zn-dependent oxidoreductase